MNQYMQHSIAIIAIINRYRKNDIIINYERYDADSIIDAVDIND
jgi:hypothetical protein